MLRTVKKVIKGKGEIVSRQDVKGTMIYPKMGWDRLELPDNHYEFRGKDLLWDYSDANIPYEGSYLTATSEMSRDITTDTREKPKGSKQRLNVSFTQTPYGNRTSVSVDKETQITPQKVNTPLIETMMKKTEGTVIRSVKVGPKKKRKRKFVEYDKARIYLPELGITEEEMLRRGPMCKNCHKGHFGQVCPCNKCGWIHPHRGCLDRPFSPEEIPTITKVPPENNLNEEIKLTVPIKGERWCWLCKSHGPEKICPRKDEIDTEYGRQRLKELLQDMLKPQESLGEEWNNNDVTSKVSQEECLLETPSYSTEKGELIGPKIVQPPQNKTPYIKPVELGGGAQWPSKPTTTTPSESTGGVRKQSKTRQEQKPTAGRAGTGDDPEEEQSLPRPPPRGNGDGGGGGNGNNGGGDDDGDDDDDEGDNAEDDEDTETITESENGEQQNAPGGGGDGDGEPSSNPGSGNVGPRGKRGHRVQRGW